MFKAELVYLAPVIGSLAVGILCSILIMTTPGVPIAGVTIFPDEGAGAFANALYFVVLVAAGATMLYVLLKRHNRRVVNVIIGFAVVTAVFMLSIVYLYALLSRFAIPFLDLTVLGGAVCITAFSYYMIFKSQNVVGNIVILFIGGALGTFLGAAIPVYSAVLILGFLAAYDVVAVYRGPVGKIAKSGLDQLRGLSVSFKDIQMGLGDLTFYSMLSGLMLLNFGYVACFAAIVGTLVGCIVSFMLLERKGMFPGLPFPILFGLVAGFLVSFL
jgi:presenilin-like A22 family membrane protease